MILREGFRMMPYRGKKKKGWTTSFAYRNKDAVSERCRIGGKKKKEAGRRRLRAETRKPSKPVTVHRIGRSDRGPDGSMLFSHGTVPYLKQTVNLNGSRVSRSDCTVRSGFNNLAL